MDTRFSKQYVFVENASNCWNLHPPRGKCLKTHYFRIVALICSINGIKDQILMENSLSVCWFFNLSMIFLFSQHFPLSFGQKSIILAIQNISTVVDSTFMTWMLNLRRWMQLSSHECSIHDGGFDFQLFYAASVIEL